MLGAYACTCTFAPSEARTHDPKTQAMSINCTQALSDHSYYFLLLTAKHSLAEADLALEKGQNKPKAQGAHLSDPNFWNLEVLNHLWYKSEEGAPCASLSNSRLKAESHNFYLIKWPMEEKISFKILIFKTNFSTEKLWNW